MDFCNIVHRNIVEDICESCPPGKYCILKEIVLHSGISDRLLIQLKCIEKFKYEKSASLGRDIGWEEAHRAWVGEGYSKKFGKFYADGMSFREIYTSIVEEIVNGC